MSPLFSISVPSSTQQCICHIGSRRRQADHVRVGLYRSTEKRGVTRVSSQKKPVVSKSGLRGVCCAAKSYDRISQWHRDIPSFVFRAEGENEPRDTRSHVSAAGLRLRTSTEPVVQKYAVKCGQAPLITNESVEPLPNNNTGTETRDSDMVESGEFVRIYSHKKMQV